MGRLFFGRKEELLHRQVLENQIELLKNMNLEVVFGYEIEFYLQNDNELQGNKGSYELLNNKICLFKESLLIRLHKLEIGFEKFHSEFGNGQFELVLGKQSPLELIDKLRLAKGYIRRLAKVQHLKCSFEIEPKGSVQSSSQHFHHSLKSLNDDASLINQRFMQFYYGNIALSREYHLLIDPSLLYFKRGGVFRGGKKYSPIVEITMKKFKNPYFSYMRLIDGKVKRCELRGASPNANPYIILSTIIAAGIYGIKNELTQSYIEKISPILVPSIFDEAVDCLRKGKMTSLLGESFIANFIEEIS